MPELWVSFTEAGHGFIFVFPVCSVPGIRLELTQCGQLQKDLPFHLLEP